MVRLFGLLFSPGCILMSVFLELEVVFFQMGYQVYL